MKELTDITCILDASGSMGNLTAETIAGFNKFVEEQKAVPGEALLTLVTFDNTATTVLEGLDLQKVPPLTGDTYKPGGSTALYQTICDAIDATGRRLAALPEEERPNKVIFFVTTDGEENASPVFKDPEEVRKRIQLQEGTYSWTFIFSAANQDAFLTGASLGIQAANTFNYVSSKVGTQELYRQVTARVTSARGVRS